MFDVCLSIIYILKKLNELPVTVSTGQIFYESQLFPVSWLSCSLSDVEGVTRNHVTIVWQWQKFYGNTKLENALKLL